jgi:hypothetical protein
MKLSNKKNKYAVLTIVLFMHGISITHAQSPAFYDVINGNGNGLRFWESDGYKIHMGNSAEYQFGPVTDYSIKTNMTNHSGRGWTWGIAGEQPVAALSNQGNMQLGGQLMVGANLGVGTTAPFNPQGWNRVLDVNGASHAKALVTAGGSSHRMGIYSHTTWYSGGGFVGTESNHHLYLIAAEDPKMVVQTNGNVGIGTLNPDSKLSVSGTVHAKEVKVDLVG